MCVKQSMSHKEIEYMIEEDLVQVALQNGSLKMMDLIRYYQKQYNDVWMNLQDALMRDGSHTMSIALPENGTQG